MLGRKVALVCLSAVVLGVTGLALAAAVKVQLVPYDPATGIAFPNPDATGQAVLNYAKGAGKTEIQVNCAGLVPGADYQVMLGAPGARIPIGGFTAKKNGTGNVHVKLQGDATQNLSVLIKNLDTGLAELKSIPVP